MKIVKSTILASMLIVGLGSTAVAENLESGTGTFFGITLSPDTDGGTIEGYKFDGSGMIGALGGKKNLFSDSIGLYGGVNMTYNTTDEDGNSDPIYGYRIFNVGVTYSPVSNLTLMTGIGYSWEFVEFIKNTYYYDNRHYMSEEENNNINFNMELMYTFTDTWGLVVGYNTAPSAMNYGVSFAF